MILRIWCIIVALAAAGLLLGRFTASWDVIVLPGALAVLGGVAWLLARGAVFPLRRVRVAAERLARGDASIRLENTGDGDADAVLRTLNLAAAQFTRRIEAIARQRSEADAILASMQEGVLAVDSHERVLLVNGAMEQMLGLGTGEVRGRMLQETVRHAGLHRYVGGVLAGTISPRQQLEGEILDGPNGQVFRVKSAPLRDGDNRVIGLLVLLWNVTRLQRLERMQKDFVGNVSHELRTPVAGIKGYAETLLDGTLEEPELARRFVEIIHRQAGRLHSLIEDLLSLSWMENPGDVQREEVIVADLLAEAVELCALTAREREAIVTTRCSDELTAWLSPRLMEQALVNLVENAMRYGGPNPRVEVSAESDDAGMLVLRVRDEGPGIAPEHIDRLFDRFYRIDRGRARHAGGTGLGLSIVRHVAEIHGGTATVESRLRRGSVFTITIPLARPMPATSPQLDRP